MSKFIRVQSPWGKPINWLINIDHIVAINTNTNIIYLSTPVEDDDSKLVVSPASMDLIEGMLPDRGDG